MKYPKLRELREAITSLIKRPYTTKFPYRPHVPFKEFRGKPEFFKDDCIGCGACAQVCPARAIEEINITDTEPPQRKFILRHDLCMFCGQCQAYCLTKEGVKLTNEYDLAVFERNKAFVEVEKELLLCEGCKCVISTKEHIIWLYKKLGHLSYANPLFILTSLRKLSLVEEEKPLPPQPPATRAGSMRILCPKCRREVLLKEAGR